jgi:RHS repeat-associated protein
VATRFCEGLLERVHLQVPLGQQPLQPRILLLQITEPLHVAGAQAPKAMAPAVIRRLGNPFLSAKDSDRSLTLLCLLQKSDNLLVSELSVSHLVLPFSRQGLTFLLVHFFRSRPEGANANVRTHIHDHRMHPGPQGGTTHLLATYTYDAASQLLVENHDIRGITTCSYDSAGNQTLVATPTTRGTLTCDAADQLINDAEALPYQGAFVPWATSATFGYDGNGNRQREDLGRRLDSGWINWSTTYTWDPGNHLLQVTHSSGSTGTDQTNSYRPDGLRHRKTEGANAFQMVWDRQDVLAEVDGSGSLRQFYSGGAALVKAHIPGTFYVDQYQHLDEQGTVVIQSDPTGAALIGVVDPNPWGGYNTLNPIGWLGQPGYWYEATLRRPLYYVRARWYQTGGPGWLSADPLRFGGGDWNLYQYVGNRPNGVVDPSGRASPTGGTKGFCDPNRTPPHGAWCGGMCSALHDVRQNCLGDKGITLCDPITGQMECYVCNMFPDMACQEQHEKESHTHEQNRLCCARLQACIEQAAGNADQEDMCCHFFRIWETNRFPYDDNMQRYQADLACECRFYTQLGCKGTEPAGTACASIAGDIARLKTAIPKARPSNQNAPQCPDPAMWPVRDPTKLQGVTAGPEVKKCSHPKTK